MIFVSGRKTYWSHSGEGSFFEERERLIERGSAQFADWDLAERLRAATGSR